MLTAPARPFTTAHPLTVDNAPRTAPCLNARWFIAKHLPRGEGLKRKTLFIVALLIPVALFAVALMSLDEPEYEVLEQTDAFELRAYKPFVVAETRVDGDFDEVGSRAFSRLVSYIQGENQGGRNLPMTAPVNQQRVADGSDGSTWLFQFVMPKEYVLQMLPQPIDDGVTLRQIPARLVAARRYSGGWGEQKYRANEQALLEALRQERLLPVGAPIFARYNAPFIPGFLRRNEVLVEVER